jgi:WD40 repeat protein
MAAKKGFSERVWSEIINADMTGSWIDATVASARKSPDGPFADVGPVLESILAKGVTKDQLSRVARMIRYETVFETVELAAEEQLDVDQLEAVHEELLTSDPSGLDGRPGSWPLKAAAPPATKGGKSAGKAKKSADPDAPLLVLPKGDDFAFAPDASRLWLAHTSVNKSTVRGIAIPGGDPFVEFNSLPNLRGVVVSPDATRLAVSSHAGIVAVHDAATGAEVWKTRKTGHETYNLAYAPDGSMVLNSGGESFVRRRDAQTGNDLPPMDFGEGWLAGELAFAPDGNTLAVLAIKVPGEPHVSHWDWRAGRELRRHPHPDRAISGLQFLPDGNRLLVTGFKGFEVWDAKSHTRVSGVEVAKLRGVSLRPRGDLLAADTSGQSQVREFPSGALLKTLDTEKLYPSHWVFAPDGRYLLLVASPKSFLWDVATLLGR